MKGMASRFSSDALQELKKLGVELTDAHDYSEDELLDIYERITEELPYDFDAAGEPLQPGRIFEEIVDVLTGLDDETTTL